MSQVVTLPPDDVRPAPSLSDRKETPKMKKLLIALAVVAGGIYFVPQLLEGTGSPCAAVEMRAVRASTKPGQTTPGLAIGFFALSDGRMASVMMRQELPGLPPPLACAVTYWFVGLK